VAAPLSATVQRAHAEGGAEAVRRLARAGRGPIVEPTADPAMYDVTFVFADRRGAVAEVGLFCPAVPEGFARLTPLGEATFAATFRLPATARVRYHFCPDPPADLDPDGLLALAHSATARRIDYFNPGIDQVHIRGLRMRMLASLLVLPQALKPPAAADGSSRGTVRELKFDAGSFGHDKRIALYLPPDHDPGVALPMVLLLESNDEWRGVEIFDSLLATGRIGACTGVLLGGSRHYTAALRDLGSGAALTRFVVVPAGGHAVAGFSAAAPAAATICADEPDLFPRLAAISGAWQLGAGMNVAARGGPSRLIERYARAPRLPRRAYLAAGRYEQSALQPIHEQTAALARILDERGTSVRFDSGFTDHDAGSARAHLAGGLAWLQAGSTAPFKCGESPVGREPCDPKRVSA
jgi:enterochelin esterase-like enzyme